MPVGSGAAYRPETQPWGARVSTDPGGGPRPNPADLPLLPQGTHFGAIVGFEPLSPVTQQVVDRLWRALLAAGMQTGRIHLDWASVELGPGLYDQAALGEPLHQMATQGLHPFVGIYAIDSEGLTLPADLLDNDSPTGILGGRSIDDPEILNRYRAMLDWAVPAIVAKGGYVLSIANEPDGYMEELRSETDNVLRFFAAARSHAHSIDPRLGITVTLTGSPVDEKKFFHDDLMQNVDVASYNYACLALTDRLVLRTPLAETVPADLDALVAVSHGKLVLIQELGCPAGWAGGPSVIGTSNATQAEFFRLATRGIRARPSIRAAYVFQLVDWSETLTKRYIQLLESENLPQVFIDSFEEWLRTTGLVTFEQGTIRPAWLVFSEAVAD